MHFLELSDQWSSRETAGVVIIPVPFEQTSSYGIGSRSGPEAIIAASSEVELFDSQLGIETYRHYNGIATIDPVLSDSAENLADMLDQRVSQIIEHDRYVVTIGGEHTSIIGAVRAHCRKFPNLTIIQFDAHSDLRETYQDSRWSHACAMSRILDFHDKVIQIGIRSQAREEHLRARELELPVMHAHEIHFANSPSDWMIPILDECSEDVYVTFDCDVFDPSIMPATGTPEPGGLSWHQIDLFMNHLTKNHRLIGFDITELAPIEGINHPQFTMARLIYRWLGYMVNHA